MQPEALLFGNSCKRRQVIDRARVHATGIGDEAGGLHTGGAIYCDSRPQSRQIKSEILVARNEPQGPMAKPQYLDRLSVAAVELVRAVEAQRPCHRLHVLFP